MAVVALAAGLLALRAQRDASANADRARARELGIAAINALRDDPELGLLLAIEAASIDDDVPAEVIDALHQSLQALRIELTVISPGDPGRSVAGGVAYSPDGTRLATTGDGISVAIWDADTGAEVATVGPDPPDFAALPISRGRLVRARPGGDLRRISARGVGCHHRRARPTTCPRPRPRPVPERSPADADAQRIVTAGWADAIRVWDPGSGGELRQTQPEDVQLGSGDRSHRDQALVTGSDDHNAYIYDLETLDEPDPCSRGHTDGVDRFATFSPDGSPHRHHVRTTEPP